jgi:ABC-2 type transport system permease protein
MSTTTTGAVGQRRPRSAARDTLTLVGRGFRLARRNTDALYTGLALPVILVALFVEILGGAIHTGLAYVDYVVPGVLLLTAGFVSAQTAVTVNQDMTGGMIDRLKSMDISGTAVLAGHVVTGMLRNLASLVLALAVSFALGFRTHASPLDWAAATGIVLLFIFAFTWLAAAVGLLAKSPEGAGNVVFAMIFLPYPSSAFVPVDTMPTWIRGFALHQPITPIIDTFRGLLLHTPTGHAPLTATFWCVGLLAMAVTLAAALFRRQTA